MTGRVQIDAVLRRAVDDGDVPGVVALAASGSGPLYEAAFGVRSAAGGPAMTLDTVFRIYSMTKAVTCVAAMRLVEAGKLRLDGTVPAISPTLAAPQVLEGFDASGRPRLRPARRPISLKHLMTHTAGFTYEFWNADTLRYAEAAGALMSQPAALERPLAFDPGERWEYGINIDWVGRIVEAVSGQSLDEYLREHVFVPLGMVDTGFVPTPEQQARRAAIHQRQPDSSLLAQPLSPPAPGGRFSGGGGLSSTGRDYLRFLRMLLLEGALDGARILSPETVALMHRNHLGDLRVAVMRSAMPEISNDVELFPGAELGWSLGHMVNLGAGPNGRSAGTVGWAGLGNLYYWLDPARRVAGVLMTQILPFADPAVLRLYGEFERGVYALAGAGGE